MKRILLILSLLPAVLSAQPVAQTDYIRAVQGLSEAELKTALHNLIQPQTILGYGGGEGRTWAGFAAADDMGDGTVRDRYSHQVRRFNGNKAVDGMNIEHIWANSWWGHTVNNAYCDLFNLYPADRDANGQKSNNPIGIVSGRTAFDNDVTRVGISDSYRPDSLITAWEPADEWKGDFARTYFYMATTYQHMSDEWQTKDGLLTVDPHSWQTMRPWVYQLMMEWAAADPVDDIERARNDAIAAIQGNRNPFVDWPGLEEYMWGEQVGETFYLDPESTAPELFVPAEGRTVDFGLQALSLGLQRSVSVRGRNLAEGLRATIVGDGFAMEDAELTPEEIEAGAQLALTSTATEAGTYEATLVLACGDGFEQHVPLRMTMMEGIPAFGPRDITCSQYVKRFTASWMDMHLPQGEAYTLNVYTKAKNGSLSAVKGSPFAVADTFYVVNAGLSASKTYYYTVSNADGTLVSNEVQVDMPAMTPSFTVPSTYLLFSGMPDVASASLPVTLSVKYLPAANSGVTMTCTAPFEFCLDGETWLSQHTMQLPKTTMDTTFQVRLAGVPDEGRYEGLLTLSADGVSDIEVTLDATVEYNRGFFENFELNSKSSYVSAALQCSAALWYFDDCIIASDNRRNDSRSVRIMCGGTAEMQEDKPLGCDSLWFWAGLFNKDEGTTLTVSYSLDSGVSWTPVVSDLAFDKGTWDRYGYKIDRQGDIRLRFTAGGASGKRVNLDDVQMSDYGLLVVPVPTMEWMSEETAPTLVYTFDGRYVGTRVPNRPGIYILRRGSHVTKHIVR